MDHPKVQGVDKAIMLAQKEYLEQVEAQKELVTNELVEDLKESTPIDTGEARESWYKDEDGMKNDADHIDDLNLGTSKQAPSFFIEKTLLSSDKVKPNGTIVVRK